MMNRAAQSGDLPDPDEALLRRLGERVRNARNRRGMTRKALSAESGVSERFLAQLEAGLGNVSIARLQRIAAAMALPLHELVRDDEAQPVERGLIEERLARLDPAQLATVRAWLQQQFGRPAARHGRIALIGLRGAGKTAVGSALAARLDVPFVQLNRLAEEAAGMTLQEVFDLLGQAAFRRLERQCLERLVATHERCVVETGGGVVADAATFELLLSRCFTVWLRARPEEHMARVVAQGDSRPMAASREAMADLRRILAVRVPLYEKADVAVDTSGRTLDEVVDEVARLAAPDASAFDIAAASGTE